MTSTLILPIDKLPEGKGGGKAQGLKKLKKLGMNIPETFVVLDFDEAEIENFVSQLPTKTWAVRSSADVEDGTEHSYAGQFQTYLNLNGKEEIVNSIKLCFESAASETVKSYKKGMQTLNGKGMNVLVQEMISPDCSGVIFTADPVKQRHDLLALSITKGIGEELMSGHEAGENFSFFKHGKKLPKSELLNPEVLSKMVSKAKKIEIGYNKPADLEWAIDNRGMIWWLQLRPITSLNEVHMNELDHKPLREELIYTRGNIGEMMPGPVTPLTMSTFAKAIEIGLQEFYVKIGAQKELTDKNLYVHSFYNHLFFDMEELYNSTRKVFMSKKENIDFAIAGEIIPDKEVKMQAGFFRGILNFVAMSRFINSAPKAYKKLKKMHDSFLLAQPDDYRKAYKIIDQNLKVLFDAYALHYVTSSQSGALYTTILQIHSKRKLPQPHHQELVAKLYTNITDVESADVLRYIDELAGLLVGFENIKTDFIDVSDEKSILYLTKTGPKEVIQSWNNFMQRHGHRCVREAEMHEKEWAVDPMPVIEGLKTKTALLVDGHKSKINGFAYKKVNINENGLSPIGKQIVKLILPKARKAVARREQTKAWSIGIQYKFKKAYQHLADLLVKAGLLTDQEQIYFLQHSEIGKLITSDNPEYWIRKANQRRKIYPVMQTLSFPDLSFGIPVPEVEDHVADEGGLRGIPVSQGIVTGKVRLVKSMKDAKLLEKDEIMVARFTDIGWTPFYSVLGGLITEIGSPLSHGAVVAREYGLPAVVSMKGAMSTLKNGQEIELDAVKGTVEVLG